MTGVPPDPSRPEPASAGPGGPENEADQRGFPPETKLLCPTCMVIFKIAHALRVLRGREE